MDHRKFFFCFLWISLVSFSVNGAGVKRFWRGTTNKNWNNTGNWSATSGGATGASVPVSTDTAYFDSGASQRCNMDINVSVAKLELKSNFADTLYQNSKTITVGAGGFKEAAGLFLGNTGNITITTTYLLSGGTFVSPGSTLNVTGNFTFSGGTFTHNSGIVFFGTGNTITGSITLYQLEFQAGHSNQTFIVAGGTTITVNHKLVISGLSSVILNTGAISVIGDIVITNTGSSGGGSATITINSTSTQRLTGSGVAAQGKLCNVTINKSSGTLFLVDIISFDVAFVYTAGTVDGDSFTSTAVFTGSGTLDPENSSYSVPFYDVQIAASRTLSGKLTALHDLTINSSQTLTNGGFDINVGRNWVDNGTFSTSGGYVKFDGSSAQTISKASGSESFKKLWIDNSTTSTVTLSSPVIVSDTFKIKQGKFVTTSTNLLTLNDNAGVLGGADIAYVSGPMKKIGNEAINFPLGSTSLGSGAYHPLAITAPSSATDAFIATYLASTQSLGSTKVDSIYDLSTCEKWTVERTAGSSNVQATIGWNSNSCNITSIADLTVSNWDGSKWADLGGQSLVVNWPKGSLQSVANLNFTANPVTIIFAKKKNKLPYDELSRTPDGGIYYTLANKLQFKFDDEYNNINHNLSYRILNSSYVDITATLIATTNNAAVSVYGDNRFRLDLYTSSGAIASGYYVLEVTNEKNEKWFLRFNK